MGKAGERGSVAERFEKYTIPEPNSGCLLWFGSCSVLGYGQLSDHGKSRAASHIALELAGRPLTDGQFACHRCDNPYCVNADHLFAGDQQDNVDDMIAKGRARFDGLELGRAHNRTPRKTIAQVAAMSAAGLGPVEIGRTLGMARQTVTILLKRERAA